MSSVRRMELWAHVTFWAKKRKCRRRKGKKLWTAAAHVPQQQNEHDANVTNLQLLDQMCWYCTYKGRAIFGILGYTFGNGSDYGTKEETGIEKIENGPPSFSFPFPQPNWPLHYENPPLEFK